MLPTRSTPARFVAGAIALALCAAAGCRARESRTADIEITWQARMSPTSERPLVADLRLRDGSRHPIRGARLEVHAFMSHPGMAPVVATAAEGEDGVYRVELPLTMAGDWRAVVQGTLEDGRTLRDEIDIGSVPPAG